VTWLALDAGRSEVTAAVWSPGGLVSVARAPYAGDSARDLWDAVEAAVGSLSADLVEVEAVGCAGTARYLLLTREGEPLTPVLSVLPEDVGEGYVSGTRDFVASLLTGRLATDPTVASATGFFNADGTGADPRADRMPPQRGSTEVLGDLMLPAARRLGLRSRIPVVMGATSETCAVEGAGALPVAPLVTYGTPVLVHVPVEPPAPAPPAGVALRAGGRSYQMYEASMDGPGEVAGLVAALAPDAKFLYGTGDAGPRWWAALASAVGLPVAHRRAPEVTTLGLAMLTATGTGAHLDRDEANPIAYADEPGVA